MVSGPRPGSASVILRSPTYPSPTLPHQKGPINSTAVCMYRDTDNTHTHKYIFLDEREIHTYICTYSFLQ